MEILNWILENIIDFLWQNDKQKHIVVSCFLLVSNFSIRYFLIQKRKNVIYALSFALRDTILIWLFKEFLDLLGFGDSSIDDFIANCIGFMFPLYLYFTYKHWVKLKKEKDLLNYTDDTFRHLFKSLGFASKEVGEWLYYRFLYHGKKIKDKINEDSFSDLEIFIARKKSRKEIQEWYSALKKLWKSMLYILQFLAYSIIDFIIEVIKMPFVILLKTLYYVFNWIAVSLERFK